MDPESPPGMAASSTSASMRVSEGSPANKMGPNVSHILQQMSIQGFHDFLVGRLQYLSRQQHWRLQSNLDRQGWPLHLRSMKTASWQVESGAPWAPADQKSLLTLSVHGVEIEDIAHLFFEGRTVNELQTEIEAIKAGMPLVSIEGQQSRIDLEALREHHSTKATEPAPVSTPLVVKSFTKRLTEVSSSVSRARSDTPYADSRKDWDQADRDIVWDAVQRGLTSRQIQAQYLPFRSESAIQTRMSKERAIRGVQTMPTKCSNRDNDLVMKLADEGHDFEDIASRLSRERTPQQIETRYRSLKKQAEVSRMNIDVNLIDDDGDVEMEEEGMQVGANEEEGSEYNEETSQAVQRPPKPKSARKTVPAKGSPKSSSKKTPSSIASIRNKLLNSIDSKHLDSDGKKKLRKALNKTGWPTRFISVEEHDSPLPEKTAQRWSDQDLDALRCIRETAPSIPYKFLERFFPGRSQTAIRNMYNTKVAPGPNYNGRKK